MEDTPKKRRLSDTDLDTKEEDCVELGEIQDQDEQDQQTTKRLKTEDVSNIGYSHVKLVEERNAFINVPEKTDQTSSNSLEYQYILRFGFAMDKESKSYKFTKKLYFDTYHDIVDFVRNNDQFAIERVVKARS